VSIKPGGVKLSHSDIGFGLLLRVLLGIENMPTGATLRSGLVINQVVWVTALLRQFDIV
jgi:hypothetical protein